MDELKNSSNDQEETLNDIHRGLEKPNIENKEPTGTHSTEEEHPIEVIIGDPNRGVSTR